MARIGLTAIGVTLLLSGAGTVLAQPAPACLHGPSETQADQARRVQALDLAHTLNRAENRAKGFGSQRDSREYLPLDQLLAMPLVNAPATPEGFQVQLQTDGSSYTLALKDMNDPCRYAIFSDQSGYVYEATPSTPQGGCPASRPRLTLSIE